MAVEMLPIESSAILSIGYHHETGAMRVEFCSGKVYEYERVPEGVFQKLKAAPSKGRHFIQYIRNAYFYRVVDKNSTPTILVPGGIPEVAEGELPTSGRRFVFGK